MDFSQFTTMKQAWQAGYEDGKQAARTDIIQLQNDREHAKQQANEAIRERDKVLERVRSLEPNFNPGGNNE